MKTLNQLQFLRIVTREGELIGHVFDVRSAGAPKAGQREGERAVTELVYGRLGLLERLGLRQAKVSRLPWSCVRSVGKDEIVVALEPGTAK